VAPSMGIATTLEWTTPVSDSFAEQARQTIQNRLQADGAPPGSKVVRSGQLLIIWLPGGDIAKARASASSLVQALSQGPAPVKLKLVSVDERTAP
jgi:hypothetical protein